MIATWRYGWKVTPVFRWYDMWIGAYIDRTNRCVYVFPIPMLGLRIDWPVTA